MEVGRVYKLLIFIIVSVLVLAILSIAVCLNVKEHYEITSKEKEEK